MRYTGDHNRDVINHRDPNPPDWPEDPEDDDEEVDSDV